MTARIAPRILAVVAGGAFGLGVVVLLQQFAVLALTLTTLLVGPGLGAVVAGGAVHLLRRRHQGRAYP